VNELVSSKTDSSPVVYVMTLTEMQCSLFKTKEFLHKLLKEVQTSSGKQYTIKEVLNFFITRKTNFECNFQNGNFDVGVLNVYIFFPFLPWICMKIDVSTYFLHAV